MDEPEYQRPDDFDLDGDFNQDNADIASILADHDIDDWRDIIANVDFLDGSEVRPGVYFSAADAISEAADRGILDFVFIFWDGEDWRLVVSYPLE